MDRVEIRRIKELTNTSESGCWIWLGATGHGGYGNMSFRGRVMNVHRAIWIAAHGAIPPGVVVCHSCDTPACVNPQHLFTGTQRGNLADMTAKGRRANGPTQSEKIRAGWTDELRAYRAKQTRERLREDRERKAMAAGVPLDWKRCPSCEQWFSRDGFYRNAAREDGLKPHCKACSVEKDMTRRRAKSA